MSRHIGLRKSTAFYRVRYACKHTGLVAQWIGTDEAQKAAEQEMLHLSNEMCPQCQAWEALQSVPSYVESQAQAFAAEPEPVPQLEVPYDAPHCPQCGWLYAFGNVSHLCDECKAKQREIPLSERGQLNGDRTWSLLK